MSKKPNVVRGTTPAKRRRIATVDRSDLNEVLALKAGVINGGDVEIEKGMGFELRGSKYRPKRAWEATVTWEYGGDQYEHELNEDEIRSMVKSIEPPEDGESLSEIDFVEHEVKVVYEKRAPDKGGGGNEVRFEGKLDATLTSLSYGLMGSVAGVGILALTGDLLIAALASVIATLIVQAIFHSN